MIRKLKTVALISGLTIALAATACSSGGAAVQPPQERTIHMAAVEPKGSATIDKEPFPAQALPLGAGYGLNQPDQSGTWSVETYRWEPGTVVVNEGDTVNLEIIGINGKEHPTRVEGYDLSSVVKRGEVKRLTFVANKPGIFRIICETHKPTMQADLVVLKR